MIQQVLAFPHQAGQAVPEISLRQPVRLTRGSALARFACRSVRARFGRFCFARGSARPRKQFVDPDKLIALLFQSGNELSKVRIELILPPWIGTDMNEQYKTIE